MATLTQEHEVLELEQKYWQAIQDNDVDTAVRLTDDPCMLAGAQGVMQVGREQFREMMTQGNFTLHRFALKGEPQVRLLREDVAIIAYQITEDLTVEGKPVTLNAADSSTWIRRNGDWVCALHTEAIAGDPYGRNRKAQSP